MSEDPKAFLQQHAPPRKVAIICPISGRSDVYTDQEGNYLHFSAVFIDSADISKIPNYFEKVSSPGQDMLVYDAADLLINEVCDFLRDYGIRALEVYRVYPTETMINPHPLPEAEDPKNFLIQRSLRTIWPSENYYINLWTPTEDWNNGEFCPAQINPKSELMQFDGMYDLTDQVYAAMGVEGREPSTAEENVFEKEYGKYMDVVYDSVKQGVTHGTLDGIAGPRNWQIVYAPKHGYSSQVDWSKAERVEPGKQYGERITPAGDRSTWPQFNREQIAAQFPDEDIEEALKVAQAILDGEDPKSVFRQMRGPEPLFLVKVSVFNRPQRTWRDVGSFTINADTGRVTKQQWAAYFTNRPTPEDLKGIVASLRKHGDAMAGHYPLSDPWPGRFHWEAEFAGDISRHRPVLVVEGPGWTVRGPLMKNTEHGDYIWRFNKLTPEQHKILKDFGEWIHYAMNEGEVFKGELDNEETWDIDHGEGPFAGPIHIKWYVHGSPDFALPGSWAHSDWSGLAAKIP